MGLWVTKIIEEDWLWEWEGEKGMFFGVFLVIHQYLAQTSREAVKAYQGTSPV